MKFAESLKAVDVHAAGLPGRVIVGGVSDIPGDSIRDKMVYLRDHRDDIRKLMLNEPRGNPTMCCNIVLPSTDPEAVAGYVIMEHIEYPSMSGTNTICTATVLIETEMIEVTEPVSKFKIESPAGLIEITAEVRDGKATSITFRNVPAYAVKLDAPVEVPGIGTVMVDIAWGGMFYVIAEAEKFGLRLTPDEGKDITRISETIKVATREQYPTRHPENPEVDGITISQLSGPPHDPRAHRRNAVTMATGTPTWDRPDSFTGIIDRSPCGTGTCAKMATLHARGQLGIGEDFVHESIIGSLFTGRLVSTTTVGPYPAVIPTITGQAWITGFAEYVIDPSDPFPTGFTVGDIWPA